MWCSFAVYQLEPSYLDFFKAVELVRLIQWICCLQVMYRYLSETMETTASIVMTLFSKPRKWSILRMWVLEWMLSLLEQRHLLVFWWIPLPFWQMYRFLFIFILQALHSLSDMISDCVTLGTVNYSRRPPNKKWIYGYGKLETVSSLFVAGILLGTSGAVFVHISTNYSFHLLH